jgi:proton glutamate symport protein
MVRPRAKGRGEGAPKPWWKLSLSQQIVVGLIVGIIGGYVVNVAFPVPAPLPAHPGGTVPLSREDVLAWPALIRDIFLHLIRMMVAPLVFASLVAGIAGHEDMKKVGRIGLKSLVYFEVLSGLALGVGLFLVNFIRPGAGVTISGDVSKLSAIQQSRPHNVVETILHIFPTSVFQAMAEGDVLQIAAFSVVFAIAVSLAGEAGKPILDWCSALREVMFKFAGAVMIFAPFGVAGAIMATVGDQGLGVLLSLGKLVLSLYFALVVFSVFIFGAVIWLTKIPLLPFVRATREPFTLAFATANSEAALPDAFAKMERFGVPRGIVGFVLPMGYSFNLDGTTLYLAMASVFIAQAAETATHIHFGLGQQITMMLTLMLTSKGVAAVPRVSMVVLIATLQSFSLPLEGAAMILGVDAFMDMARTSVNVLGNCLASVVIARWEGEFDEKQAVAEFGG